MSNFSFDIGNHRYELVRQDLNWSDAAANAKALGGHLASIGSEEENNAVFQAVAAHLKGAAVPVANDGGASPYLWLGASDQLDATDPAGGGDWRWQDGSALDYNNWGYGAWGQEPDNFTDAELAPDGQHRAALALADWPKGDGTLGSAAQWNDLSRHDKLWSLVEYDTPTFVLNGGAGNDLLDANPKGHNRIDGGAGIDTVRIHANQEDYAISLDDKGLHLVSVNGNLDSNIELSNVERVGFDDGSLAFDIQGTGGQAYRLYQAAFDRAPDLAGLGHWMGIMDAGTGLTEVARSFLGSAEFIEHNGSDLDNATFVTLLYANVLHRLPEAAGFDHWMTLLEHGTSAAQVLVSFSESQENQAQVIGSIGNGFAFIPHA
ncbi:DUF4214 domain-containing protein [Rugamonas sp. CCM 8940]|uniref:DUF4214 domain-containing protein n=1 Tax=Rugamonas sp. CCM 8940 TaxID=2765359 RepID=UPI0018F44D8D|nr:DUF4214 domain-containing protein [Rugamonas sp. CCM 8940]MBJ7312734.1 DUF4214 domain-containing protein [Rugamonas sp. CCM 8940]